MRAWRTAAANSSLSRRVSVACDDVQPYGLGESRGPDRVRVDEDQRYAVPGGRGECGVVLLVQGLHDRRGQRVKQFLEEGARVRPRGLLSRLIAEKGLRVASGEAHKQ